MIKEYTSLGLMSGTSGDGVDASIITTNGIDKFEVLKNQYFEYDKDLYLKIHELKAQIQNLEDLHKFKKECDDLEKKITLFHAKVINDLSKKKTFQIVGFHGQTILHNSANKITKQLGDEKLLYQLIKKNLVFNFRHKDILNGGEGAPLTPIFHQVLANQLKIDLPSLILNIGGITNFTLIKNFSDPLSLISKDIGPGNCLIDTWIRNNTKLKFDHDGDLASKGITNKFVLEQAQEMFSYLNEKKNFSLDTNDFDMSFVRGLSLEDGASTLTDLTAKILITTLSNILSSSSYDKCNIFICGGGRKNKYLISKIKKDISKKVSINLIDDLGVNGDFIESQAFAFLAVRTILNLPISFPNTTGCKKPTIGGELIRDLD